ncbi:MAG: hypothetical protein ACO1RX_04280 [Candidatus Sericytochromatia bacterium]
MRHLRSLALVSLICGSLSACSDLEMPSLALSGQMPGAALSLPTGSVDAQLGNRLANFAISQSSGGTGYCYQYVAGAIHAQLPAFLSGGHAYMAADQLASSPYFQEISVSRQQLASLPAGSVVVWSQGTSESGHISIADGRGNEVSDHIAPQMSAHYGGGSPRVFVPSVRG